VGNRESLTTHRFLRESTTPLHDAVELASPLSRLSADTSTTLPEYIGMLQDLHEVLEALEPIAESAVYRNLAASGSKIPKTHMDDLAAGYFFQRRRLAAADLAQLSVCERATRPELAELASRMNHSSLTTQMGLAYVLMGQSLGAAMLHRCLMTRNPELLADIGPSAQAMAQEAKPPFSFFAGHGKSSAQYWSIFLALLETSVDVSEAAACREALDGAICGFEGFRMVWPGRTQIAGDAHTQQIDAETPL
jgi:heme oxygenase